MAAVKQHFIHFLKDNNVYEQFMFDFNNRNKISKYYPKKLFIHFFKTTDETLLIYDAFNWLASPENYRFWSNINKKWDSYIKK